VSFLEVEFSRLYEIEDRIRGLTPDERLERRQMESKDLVVNYLSSGRKHSTYCLQKVEQRKQSTTP
jgi:hypothetical protein